MGQNDNRPKTVSWCMQESPPPPRGKWKMENGKWIIISCAGAWNNRQRGGTKSRSFEGKWKMENGKLFLALALGTIDREAEQRAALLRGNGGLRGLPRWVAYANKNAPRNAARGMVGVT